MEDIIEKIDNPYDKGSFYHQSFRSFIIGYVGLSKEALLREYEANIAKTEDFLNRSWKSISLIKHENTAIEQVYKAKYEEDIKEVI